MVGGCCDAVPRLIIKSCRERSCSNTSTHRHTLSLTTRTHTHAKDSSPKFASCPPLSSFRPSPLCVPCFLLEPWNGSLFLPSSPQRPPAAPNLGTLGTRRTCRLPGASLQRARFGNRAHSARPFLGAPLLQPLQPQRPPTRRYMCMCDMCVCVHCAGRCKKLSSLPEPKLCIVREPRRIEAVRPRKVAARFAAPPWGRCDRQAHVCVSASDAR